METQILDLWQQVLLALESKISKPSFDTWLSSTQMVLFDESKLIISTPYNFTKQWLESRYISLISSTVFECTNKHVKVEIVTPDGIPAIKMVESPQAQFENTVSTSFNRKYTFDTFVVGVGNQFAHAAALAVAEAPGKAYNPLFLYGGVGLGKTHLMHAIGQYVLERNPNAKVLYLSSEKFTNEFINAILNNRGEMFRNKYRSIDVLLIDDIQFIAGKEQTQEEFFHTFNSLQEEGKAKLFQATGNPKRFQLLRNGCVLASNGGLLRISSRQIWRQESYFA